VSSGGAASLAVAATNDAAAASKGVEVSMVSGIRGAGLQRTATTSFPEHAKVPATLKAMAELAVTGGASSVVFLPEQGVAARS
jgi:hypothetical protein